MPELLSLFRQAQLMKEKMAEFQKGMEANLFTGTAGRGAVTVIVNGKHEVQKVTIDPKAVQPEKAEDLQALIQAAVNDAGRQVNDKIKEEVSKMTGGLGIPGLF